MSDVTMSEADKLQARLRDLCLPWAEGYKLAFDCALQAVMELKSAFNEFAEKDPYEAGRVERWDLSVDVVRNEPVVQAMATTFSLILNRRGLLKIDPISAGNGIDPVEKSGGDPAENLGDDTVDVSDGHPTIVLPTPELYTRPDIISAALAGLMATPKTLPPELFYDDEGCRLFYEITRLPEYYQTRTEIALLAAIADHAVPKMLSDATLVQFGGSDETKARILLDQPSTPFATYMAIDVAAPALSEMRRRLAESNPELAVVPIVADFMQPLRLPPLGSQRMGFLPGSIIGNLDPVAATQFLAASRNTLGHDSWFLLGVDLRKSPRILLPAYNDAAGVTAAFNLNLLRRLNREAGTDFDLNSFRHEAVWNDALSRIEMHLISVHNQTVHLDNRSIYFRAGESIHTESSYKHTSEKVVEIARNGGWDTQKVWKDHSGLFGIFLLRSDPDSPPPFRT